MNMEEIPFRKYTHIYTKRDRRGREGEEEKKNCKLQSVLFISGKQRKW